jgi:hypothetical protein
MENAPNFGGKLNCGPKTNLDSPGPALGEPVSLMGIFQISLA